jgi:hypothetical protein
MVSKEEWLGLISAYSRAIWPAQIVFYIATILIIGWFLLKKGRIPNKIIKLYFVVVYIWIGILWFLNYAKGIADSSLGNYIFGAIFIIISLLFGVDIFRERMQFNIPSDRWQKSVSLFLITSVLCYPLLGVAFGHEIDRLIFPGTYPCPTTALGILLLTMALPQVDQIIYVLLLIMAIPFTPFVQILKYGVYEDVILFVSGVYGLILYIKMKCA